MEKLTHVREDSGVEVREKDGRPLPPPGPSSRRNYLTDGPEVKGVSFSWLLACPAGCPAP